jgi:CRISPR-associated protein Cas1
MAFDDLITTTALAAHFAEVRAASPAAGADGLRPDDVARDLEGYLAPLSTALGDGSWRPAPLLRIRGRKPGGGVRRLAIPTVADRIVIALLRHLIEQAVEPLLAPSAYAYRPGRSARGAVDAVLAAIAGGARFVALADIREFFDSIALGPLQEAMAALPLPREACAIACHLLDGHALSPGRGLAQGSALSPTLSNLALVPLDRALTGPGRALVRYCDNLCMPAATEREARAALDAMRREAGRLGLQLKEAASQQVAVSHGCRVERWRGPGFE